jgi:hypothetical protein
LQSATAFPGLNRNNRLKVFSIRSLSKGLRLKTPASTNFIGLTAAQAKWINQRVDPPLHAFLPYQAAHMFTGNDFATGREDRIFAVHGNGRVSLLRSCAKSIAHAASDSFAQGHALSLSTLPHSRKNIVVKGQCGADGRDLSFDSCALRITPPFLHWVQIAASVQSDPLQRSSQTGFLLAEG